jgi:hypothetical protein
MPALPGSDALRALRRATRRDADASAALRTAVAALDTTAGQAGQTRDAERRTR